MSAGSSDLGIDRRKPIPNPTLGEFLDAKIEDSRKRTEQLCIMKAKAEAAGLLQFPRNFLYDITGW